MNAPPTFEQFKVRLKGIDTALPGTHGKDAVGQCPECEKPTNIDAADWEKSHLIAAFINQDVVGYMDKSQVLAALERADKVATIFGPLSYPGLELAGQVSSLLSRLARSFCSLEEVVAVIRGFKNIGSESRMGMSVKLNLGDIVAPSIRSARTAAP